MYYACYDMKALRYSHVNLRGGILYEEAQSTAFLRSAAVDSLELALSGEVSQTVCGIMLWAGYKNTTPLLKKHDVVREWEKEFPFV